MSVGTLKSKRKSVWKIASLVVEDCHSTISRGTVDTYVGLFRPNVTGCCKDDAVMTSA